MSGFYLRAMEIEERRKAASRARMWATTMYSDENTKKLNQQAAELDAEADRLASEWKAETSEQKPDLMLGNIPVFLDPNVKDWVLVRQPAPGELMKFKEPTTKELQEAFKNLSDQFIKDGVYSLGGPDEPDGDGDAD